jgi:micrococcal nuclease
MNRRGLWERLEVPRRILFWVAVVLILFVFYRQGQESISTKDHPTEAPVTASPNADQATVTRVIDGDTVEVRLQGEVIDIRLIGIDTPETVAPGEPVQCYGPQASTFTESQLEGERVTLEFDIERIDRYGRTLAYVWVDGELFNETLVAQGFATVTTYPPNVKYVERFTEAQREARTADRGLWGSCQTEGNGTGDGKCDPSYPDVCIPPPPPNLNCDDVGYTNIRVVGEDPHGFDGNEDGVGCEVNGG